MARAERTVSRELAEALRGIPFAALPTEVLAHARTLILDTRMVALAGARQPDVVALTELARHTGGIAESRIWSGESSVPAVEAAFVNALAASALDYDSLHDNVHPDAIALAAAWAMAEATHASGPAFLRAYVLATELVCRLAEAVQGPQKGWTIGAVLGTFGSAAAAALLLDASTEELAHALGLCLSMAAGSQQANVEQVLAKRLQPALAARAGVQAARLARAGMTAPAEAFEGRFGLWALYFPADRERLLDGFGSRYAMLRTGLKQYPVCACSHAAMEALRTLMNDERVRADDIERVDAVISPFMHRLVGGRFEPAANPQVTAQFSLAYALASIALRGRLGIAELAPEAVLDAAIADFAGRVAIVVDERNSGELAPATVRIRLRSGREAERRVERMPGSHEAPLPAQQRERKHLECAAAWKSTESSFVLTSLITRIEQIDRVEDMAAVAA